MTGTLFSSFRNVAVVGVILVVLWMMFAGPSSPQTADLGVVLDRTEFAMSQYEDFVQEKGVETLSDDHMGEFTEFLAVVLNTEPRFYEKTIGVELQPDASILGFNDDNANLLKDEGEARLFTLEIDGENARLIATDESGRGTHSGFSGSGLLTGMLLGSMMSRQSAAGVRPGAFNNRATTSRTAYKAPSSARSRSRSGGFSVGK